MLDAADRTVLTQSLQPPPGFRVDRVISTTYTLDLVALLTLPMSFALLAGDGVNDSGRVDPIALLDALRRYAGRFHVFFDASHIAVPRDGQILFGYLESSVIEARAPQGGSFHPKVTIVRYTPDPTEAAGDGDVKPSADAVHYRLLCSSRNLTFDQSWDTMLVLDGELVTGRTLAFGRNRPLSRFVHALPRLAVRPMPAERIASIHEVAAELLRVQFEPPDGFGTGTDELAFWPIGLDASDVWPFEGCTGRLMVVSPFVDQFCFERLKMEGDFCAIVSRPEELDSLPPAALHGIGARYILADAADVSLDEASAASPGGDDSIPILPSGAQLRGLHAKLFVADAGWNARIWTGSANATNAAFTKNVEFLIELRGKKSQFGVEALLGAPDPEDAADRRVRFHDLLIPYRSPKEAISTDSIALTLERMLDTARRALVDAQLISRVVEAGSPSERPYEVRIEATVTGGGGLPQDVACTLRPISLTPDASVLVEQLAGLLAMFGPIAFESLTGFCAVSLTARTGNRTLACDFVLSVPLVGGPADRENRLLLAMLSNRERLLRYLLMLLEDSKVPTLPGNGGKWDGHGPFAPLGLPLLEPLLRMLANNPSRLTPVDRLIRDLEATHEGRERLPHDLMAIWESIRSLIPPQQAPPRLDNDASR